MLSYDTEREMLAMVQRIAAMAGVPPFQVSLSIEPLDEDPRRPYWIVTVNRGDQTGQGDDSDIEVAARKAIENL